MADVSIILKAVDQASGTLSGVTGELDKMESKSSKLGGLLKGGLMVGAGVAVAGIGSLGAVLATSVSAASEAEDIQAQLNAVLKSTGGVAGVTADAINEHALALSKVTKFEDDSIVAAQSLLLTFTKVGKDIFPDATEATLDMAQAMGMDLNSATMLVGKALNDPVKGMTALTRSGIQFTEEQKEMVAAMVAMGDTAGAQRIILKELETQFGGSAKAAGETLSGQMEILKNQFGNVKEEIGGALIPALTQLASWIGPILVRGFESFGQLLTNTIIPAISKVAKVVSSVFVGIFEDGWNVADLVGYLSSQFPALGGIMDRFKTAGEGVYLFFSSLRETLEKVGAAIASQVTPTIQTLTSIWQTSLQPAIETLSAKLSMTLMPALSRLWEWLGTVLPPAIETVGKFFREHVLPVLGDVASFIVGQVLPAVIDLVSWFIDHIPPAVEVVVSWLGPALGGVLQGVQNLIEGVTLLVGGMVSAFQSAIGPIQSVISFISDAIAKAREFLGVKDALGAGYGGTPTGKPGGPGYGSTPTGPTGGAGYGGTPGRMAGAGGLQFNITINAPGGNPQAVAVAAQTGVLAAARSMGLA